MKSTRQYFVAMLAILLLASLLVACQKDDAAGSDKPDTDSGSDSEEDQVVPEMTTDDITLKFMIPWGEEEFAERIKDDVEKEYPNITLEMASGTVDAAGMEETFAAQVVPDILLAHNGYDVLKEYDMAFPLDDLIEANNYDLDRFRDGLVDIARSRDPDGEGKLYGLPFEDMPFGLYYNKEIFDLFGVDYPEDGMTWDETLELAKQVGGEMNGVNYKGLTFTSSWLYSLPLSQLSVNGTDPETGEVLFDQKEEFTQYLDLIDRMSSLPGNEEGITGSFAEGNIAMTLTQLTAIPSYAEAGVEFNIVSFPVWSDLPDSAPYKFIGQTLAISSHSEYKQAAFKVIEYLTSKEKQTKNARLGRPSTLKDPEVMAQFVAEDYPDADFNMEGALSITPADPPLYSEWGPYIQINPNDFYSNVLTVDFLESGDDPVTAIRKAADAYEVIIEEEKKSN